MSSLNRAQLIGHLGRDPEVRYTQGNQKIVHLSVATSEKWNDRSGTAQERTEWHRVVIFNEGLAGVAERYLHKGAQLFVEGQLRTRKWTDNGGVERYSTEIALGAYNGQLVLLGGPDRGGRGEGGGSGRSGPSSATGRSAAPAQGPGPDDLDDDIPF